MLLILLPMLGTVVGLRLYLHLGGIRHIYPGGHVVHHLFIGCLLIVPASFLMALPPRSHSLALSALAFLGIGSGLILDEWVYLVLTGGTDSDYISQISVHGATALVGLAVILLLIFYASRRR